VSWCFLAAGILLAGLAIFDTNGSVRSFVFDALALIAAGGAVYGILRNRPDGRGAWLLLAAGLVLFAAGDVAYDVATRSAGSAGYPWADLLYIPAYPFVACSLYLLARKHFQRDITVDSVIVALAASAVIWQWVVTPVLTTADGATFERIVAATYPIMDVILVVAIAHAVFTIPRWVPAAWLLFGGLTVMLVADTVYARLVADGAYTDGGPLDALWPVAYFLLAGAVLHPSMRFLWFTRDSGLVRQGRARMIVLGAALFSAPAVVILDDASSGEAVALTAIVGITAALVAWRIARLVSETDRAREILAESEARFRAFVQHATDAVGVLDASGAISYVTPSVDEILGYEPHALIGRKITELVHPDDVDRVTQTLADLVQHPFEMENIVVRLARADGSWRWIETTCTNQLQDPAVRGIVGNFRDVTERRRAETFASQETQVLELVLHGAPIPEICEALLRAVEEFVGDASASIRLLGNDSAMLETIASATLSSRYVDAIDDSMSVEAGDAEDAHRARFQPVVIPDIERDDRYPQMHKLRALARAQGIRAFWSVPIRMSDEGPSLGMLAIYVRTPRGPSDAEQAMMERVRSLVGIALDRAAHTKQLGHLALHDTLTELPNRALAVAQLDSALERLRDEDNQSMVALLFLDLDRFKIVNDGLGHDTGDELLVAVGRRLAATVRRNDTVARFGGDEFVVVCEDLADEQQVMELADRAIQALSEPFALERAEVVVSASIGIAVTRRASARAASLLRDADAAMYRAKSRGGARYELFDQAMHTQAVTRLLTERGLREALERDELRVLFQPQFDLSSGKRVAEEALLRWAHPVRGIVAPADFIEIAEETGIIVPIGNWVLDQVCDRASRARLEGPDNGQLCVSANISARQLLRPDFTRVVRAALRAFDLEPSALCLEIAEHVLLDDQETTSGVLNELKDLGIRLAIDDFGTGGSSLTYLRRYPFDELKIDQAFVAGLGQSAADDAIVAATIDMAHALGMVVAAEGVETDVQRLRLIELGCDRAQGYFLAPPEALPSRHLKLVKQQPA
jgi:diguanylate cyclase (GGDEF)-like protein/PAS domain S-box-containing protein